MLSLAWTFLSGMLRKIIKVVNGDQNFQESPKKSFAAQLEAEARRLVSRLDNNTAGSGLHDSVRGEIALTLDHIDRHRLLSNALQSALNKDELYFRTKLAQLWPGKEEHVPYLWREQDKLKLKEKERWQDKLLELEHERRRLALSFEERLQPLEDRLLSLLQKHLYVKLNGGSKGLKEENGRRKAGEKA